MAKKIILILAILILILIIVIFLFNNSIDVYTDGENITVHTYTLNNIDKESMNDEICDYTFDVMNNTEANITTLKEGIRNICYEYGLDNVKINVDSIIGSNQIPVVIHVNGTSMLPTLQDGQKVLINKTHNIHIGDIVVANSSEYGGIIKRVGDIKGNSVFLQSDNKKISYEYINGKLYKISGISTWVDISDINGVVIDYWWRNF